MLWKRIAPYVVIPIIVLMVTIIALSNNGDDFKGEKAASSSNLSTGATALLTGGTITLWGGDHCFSSFQMRQMDLVPKRWGIFQWADARDIVIHDCKIRVEASALASCFEEIGKTLFQLGRSGTLSTDPAETQELGANKGEQRPTLVPLPPKIEAHNFACTLSHPQGRLLIIKADLATFEPPQPVLSLEGNVQVTFGPGSYLQAQAMDWLPLNNEIQVKTDYKICRGQERRGGRPGWFSLAGGHLKRLQASKVAGPPGPGPVVVVPPDLMAAAAAGKNPARGNKLLALLCLGLFQSSAPNNVQPLPSPPKANP